MLVFQETLRAYWLNDRLGVYKVLSLMKIVLNESLSNLPDSFSFNFNYSHKNLSIKKFISRNVIHTSAFTFHSIRAYFKDKDALYIWLFSKRDHLQSVVFSHAGVVYCFFDLLHFKFTSLAASVQEVAFSIGFWTLITKGKFCTLSC